MLRRQFELAREAAFFAEWGIPQPDRDDFRCEYAFAIGGREHRGHAFGVDAVQALIMALQRAHVDLLASPEGRRGEITWLGQKDLGLPLPSSVSASDFRSPTIGQTGSS